MSNSEAVRVPPRPAPAASLSLALSPATWSCGFATNSLVAAAFSAAFELPVVTYAEYQRRKKDPQFAKVEKLDIDKVAELSYEPATGKFGDVYGSSGDKITVWLKTLTGRKIQLRVGSDSYVEELKYLLEEHEGIPVDNDHLVFLHKHKCMSDGSRLSDYNVVDGSVIDVIVTLRARGPSIPLVLSDSVLAPGYDYDFSSMTDDGTEYYRGGKRYHRPYGWKRIALKVHGKYENDSWLGSGGIRSQSSTGEWPVSYHGTAGKHADSIAKQGYLLSKCQRFAYGKGIYSSPFIDVAAKFASPFTHKGVDYQVVFQNRTNPDGLKTCNTCSGEYWVQPDQSFVRPYGICIQAT